MSDYLFMLESHLDAGQNQAVATVRRLATEANINVWLTGGAMRDMLRGAPFRDLDFTVERDAVKTGKALAEALGGRVVSEDSLMRGVELELPGNVPASVENARVEKYSKPGGKPEIGLATIHEDLQRRDFTINAIALSLSRGSRGLLVDPTNGQADLEGRELRSTSYSVFFDDPTRLFRLIRFRHLLGFGVAARTQSWFDSALREHYQDAAGPGVLGHELRAIWSEPSAVAALEEYDSAGLLARLSPSLTDGRWNSAGLARFEEAKQSVIPPGTPGGWLAFVAVLTEKMGVRDRAEVAKGLGLTADEAALLKKLGPQALQIEANLAAPRVRKPSDVWVALREASPDEVLMVLCRSGARAVQDRIQAYYEKYLPQSLEVTEEEVAATGAKPGTPKFEKAYQTLVAARLNAKPPKVEPEPEPPPAPGQ
jgi:tRNA nucleotidyltransferase (CCA-adding enzyme)